MSTSVLTPGLSQNLPARPEAKTNWIISPRDGVIERVAFAENQLVPADAVLFAFREA